MCYVIILGFFCCRVSDLILTVSHRTLWPTKAFVPSCVTVSLVILPLTQGRVLLRLTERKLERMGLQQVEQQHEILLGTLQLQLQEEVRLLCQSELPFISSFSLTRWLWAIHWSNSSKAYLAHLLAAVFFHHFFVYQEFKFQLQPKISKGKVIVDQTCFFGSTQI